MASTDDAGMISAGQRMMAAQSSIVGHRNQLMAELNTLATTWTGESSMVFQGAMNRWTQEFDVIVRHLQTMCDQLIQGANTYTATAAENTVLANIFK